MTNIILPLTPDTFAAAFIALESASLNIDDLLTALELYDDTTNLADAYLSDARDDLSLNFAPYFFTDAYLESLDDDAESRIDDALLECLHADSTIAALAAFYDSAIAAHLRTA